MNEGSAQIREEKAPATGHFPIARGGGLTMRAMSEFWMSTLMADSLQKMRTTGTRPCYFRNETRPKTANLIHTLEILPT